MGSMETHGARQLRFHLGLASMHHVLESSYDGQDASKSGPGRQYCRENARNHQRASAQNMAFGKPTNRILKTRKIIEEYLWRDVCYCKYSDGVRWTYKKQTRLWGVMPTFVPRPVCTRKDPCPLSVGGNHPDRAQRCNRGIGVNHTLSELYSMPTELCDDIARAAATAASAVL